ncbi:MAG: NAD(+) synthase [Clostridiales bacterium]|nr:NAD(+) synthase [Clostridiales bacterium]
MQIAVGQLEIVTGNLQANLENIANLIKEAKEESIDLLVLPELALGGLLLGDVWRQRAFIADYQAAQRQIAALAGDLTVIFAGLAQGDGPDLICCFAANNGNLQPLLAPLGKSPIPGAYEAFDPGLRHALNRVQIKGREYKIACILGDWQELPAMNEKPDLLLNLGHWPIRLGQELPALPQDIPCLRLNAFGLQNTGRNIYIFPGEAVYSSPRMDFCSPFFTPGLHIVRESKVAWPRDMALLHQASVFAIRSFAKLIGLNKAVIGLSGGIDSALAACLYAEALGKDNVLLINMPSRYNSTVTKDLAARLAADLGCNYAIMPIEESLLGTVRQLTDTPINGSDGQWYLTLDAHIEENIQARDRSARVLAGVAASWQAFFTCNANKTELISGYGTFYGDLAGALAIMADLWKYQVYQLSEYLSDNSSLNTAVLKEIIKLRPSAELSELQAIELGRGDPFVYPYHDRLFAAWAESDAAPEDLLRWYQEERLEEMLGCRPKLVAEIFPKAEDFISDLEYWWKLYSGIAMAKRIQGVPYLVFSQKPLGERNRESQLTPYFTTAYQSLKRSLIERE